MSSVRLAASAATTPVLSPTIPAGPRLPAGAGPCGTASGVHVLHAFGGAGPAKIPPGRTRKEVANVGSPFGVMDPDEREILTYVWRVEVWTASTLPR